MLKTDDIIFESKDNTTIITNNATCKGTSYLLKCTFPYMKGIFKKSDQESLNGFKKYAEQLN